MVVDKGSSTYYVEYSQIIYKAGSALSVLYLPLKVLSLYAQE